MPVTTEDFQLIADALETDNGFKDGSELVQYSAETDDKFKARKELAWCPNYLASAVQRFMGYIGGKRVLRDTKNNEHYEAINNDCDGKGNSADMFMASFGLEAKARGSMLLLVDMPQATGASAAEQQDERLFPYFVAIKPETVTAYRVNERGLFDYVEISSTYYDEAEGEDVEVTRRWDTEGWEIRTGAEQGTDVLESGEYELGVCPVLSFTEKGDYPCLGEYAQVAKIQRRLLNMISERDEILRSQTFSILAMPVPADKASLFDPEKTAKTLSTHNMLIHFGDTPQFIAPPSGPADVYAKTIAEAEEKIDKITSNIEALSGAASESGVALTIRYQALNNSLAHFSRRMEDLERKAWDLVAKWLGYNPVEGVTVSYPQDFKLSDIATALETYQNMQAMGAPREYLVEKLKQIVAADLVSSEQDVIDTIIDVIDQTLHQRTDPDADGDGDGGTE